MMKEADLDSDGQVSFDGMLSGDDGHFHLFTA